MKKRDFIKTSSLALGATVLPLSIWSCENPDSILRTAHIGVSNMGFEDLKAISSHANVVVTALCDVDSNALKAANEMFPKAQIFKDYRAMFDQISDQIDAVIVSTPDHTHAPASLLAMEKNKAVYCQKPLTHFVSESRGRFRIDRSRPVIQPRQEARLITLFNLYAIVGVCQLASFLFYRSSLTVATGIPTLPH